MDFIFQCISLMIKFTICRTFMLTLMIVKLYIAFRLEIGLMEKCQEKKERLIVKWIGLNQHELMENWSRAIAGLPLKFIEPLK